MVPQQTFFALLVFLDFHVHFRHLLCSPTAFISFKKLQRQLYKILVRPLTTPQNHRQDLNKSVLFCDPSQDDFVSLRFQPKPWCDRYMGAKLGVALACPCKSDQNILFKEYSLPWKTVLSVFSIPGVWVFVRKVNKHNVAKTGQRSRTPKAFGIFIHDMDITDPKDKCV